MPQYRLSYLFPVAPLQNVGGGGSIQNTAAINYEKFYCFRFTPSILVQKVPDLSVVIDLTYTTRYYDAREVCIARAIKIHLVRMLTICVHYSKVCYNNNINNSITTSHSS